VTVAGNTLSGRGSAATNAEFYKVAFQAALQIAKAAFFFLLNPDFVGCFVKKR
jgi:hypothetical protein